jgi:hypothetical protein
MELEIVSTTSLNLELFHVQTNTSFQLPPNNTVIRIGKPNDDNNPDIDVSHLPDADIVSRSHVEISIQENNYYLQDNGSSNGTFINGLKLEPRTYYKLNLGDQIDLGQQNKVTFIFQQQQVTYRNSTGISQVTKLQPQIAENHQPSVDRASRITGLALIVVAFIIIAANTQIGIFIGIPSVLLCIAGVVVLCQRRFNRNLGWILIASGIAIILFTGRLFASVNFLAVLVCAALLFAGYQLFTTGKVWKYSLRSLPRMLRSRKAGSRPSPKSRS